MAEKDLLDSSEKLASLPSTEGNRKQTADDVAQEAEERDRGHRQL